MANMNPYDQQVNPDYRPKCILCVLITLTVVGFFLLFSIFFVDRSTIGIGTFQDDSAYLYGSNVCEKGEFEYFEFGIRWLPSYCIENKCNKLVNNSWSIGNLKPSYGNETGPRYCCSKWSFNETDASLMMNDLSENWVRTATRGDRFSIYYSEWTTYGTCAANSTEIKSQRDFFNTAIRLYKHYPLMRWLEQAKITPDHERTYSHDSFLSVIERHFGYRPKFILEKAINDKTGKVVDVIKLIYLCFTIDFKPTDCLGTFREEVKLFIYPPMGYGKN